MTVSPQTSHAYSFGQFHAPNLYGDIYTNNLFSRNDLTLVFFWGATYNISQAELVQVTEENLNILNQLSAEYAPKGVKIIGVVADAMTEDGVMNVDKQRAAIEITKKYKLTFPNILPSKEIMQGIMEEKVLSVPTTIFVRRDGEVVGNPILGPHSRTEWVSLIESYKKQALAK